MEGRGQGERERTSSLSFEDHQRGEVRKASLGEETMLILDHLERLSTLPHIQELIQP